MALWLIGIMAEMGLDLAERHNSERLRGFCDRQTVRQTNVHLLFYSRIAFATETRPKVYRCDKWQMCTVASQSSKSKMMLKNVYCILK